MGYNLTCFLSPAFPSATDAFFQILPVLGSPAAPATHLSGGSAISTLSPEADGYIRTSTGYSPKVLALDQWFSWIW
jgi:hypothetical protein